MTAFVEGQGILGRIRFVDGTMPAYNRTYLVVNVERSYIEVLNISSIHGKEKKLTYPANMALKNYNPPFWKPSFVKLDSLTRVPIADCNSFQLLSNGNPLNAEDMSRIKSRLSR